MHYHDGVGVGIAQTACRVNRLYAMSTGSPTQTSSAPQTFLHASSYSLTCGHTQQPLKAQLSGYVDDHWQHHINLITPLISRLHAHRPADGADSIAAENPSLKATHTRQILCILLEFWTHTHTLMHRRRQ